MDHASFFSEATLTEIGVYIAMKSAVNLLYCIKNPVDVSFVAIFIQTFVNYLY